MAVSRDVFQVHRDEVWRAIKDAMRGAPWDGRVLRVRHGPFVVTLDVHADIAGYSSAVVTRLRAAFMNPDAFRFRLRRRSVLSDLASLVGVQDIELGDPPFDREFVVQGNRPEQVRRLVGSAELRAALLESAVHLVEVRPDEGWFGPEFPDNVDELYVEAEGRLVDEPEIEKLYCVFAELLNRLSHLGSAYGADPHLEI